MRKAELLIVSALICVLLFCLGCVFPAEILFHLASGWLTFLVRVTPQITVNGTGVLTAVVCVLALAFGLHWFLAWLHGQGQKRQEPAAGVQRPWMKRWTAAFF